MPSYLEVDKLRQRAQKRSAHPKLSPSDLVHKLIAANPPKASLRSKVSLIYNQGNLGSCTANAFCAAYRLLEKDTTFHPSRLWVYFYERLAEDPEHKISDLADTGADVTDGESYVQVHGVCSEDLWPYDISKYNVQPNAHCVTDAKNHKIKSHKQIHVHDIKTFIAHGTPVLLAISVYPSFENSQDGKIPMPGADEKCQGGHELLIIGYDDDTKTYEVQNSWGADWGDQGFCHIPYDYIADPDLCSELTVITL